jgi:16S rRNA (uracil1498-N3)-methyltransferase
MTARIYLPQRWAAGDSLVLPPAESRHVQVLRLQPGDRIVLFNGDDGDEWPAEIVRIDRAAVAVRIGAPATPLDRELPFPVTLALGVPANERMDPLIEKATELGVAAIQPLMCERSVVRLAGDRAEARQRHWSAVAASASEQCGRVRVPEIAVPARFGAWLGAGARDDDRALSARSMRRRLEPGPEVRWLLSLGQDAASPALPELSFPLPSVVVLSGPEGGLSPAEESAARARGFEPVTLGPRTLRADTAPLALLAWLALAASGRAE